VHSVGCLSAFSALFSKNFHGAAIDCCVTGIFFESTKFSFSRIADFHFFATVFCGILQKKHLKLVVVAVQSVGCLSAISALFSKNFNRAIDCCVAGIFFESLWPCD
jgi:hypothetical protein